MDVITDGHCLVHLNYLLEFLGAWEKRPVYLTQMAYQWCCAIPEATTTLGLGEIPITWRARHQFRSLLRLLRPPNQSQDPTIDDKALYLLPIGESGFSIVGPGCDPVRLNDTSHRAPSRTPDVALHSYADLLRNTLKIGFRLAGPGRDQPALHLDRKSPNDRMFDTAFSSSDDKAIADAVCAWVADGDVAPPGSLARYFTKRVESNRTFSRRLRWATIRAIECVWRRELEVQGRRLFVC